MKGNYYNAEFMSIVSTVNIGNFNFKNLFILYYIIILY